jgi:hypothetical protein
LWRKHRPRRVLIESFHANRKPLGERGATLLLPIGIEIQGHRTTASWKTSPAACDKENFHMTRKSFGVCVIVVAFVAVSFGMALAAQQTQDKWSVKAPDGITFGEFKGYEGWQDVAVSRTDALIKVIVGNRAMIAAYKAGIPDNGQKFPDGVKVVKIEWNKELNPKSPYGVERPTTLKSVALIEKDSKRFPQSNGWGYAQFDYDTTAGTFKAFGDSPDFGTKICYACHTIMKDTDYIFTRYPVH